MTGKNEAGKLDVKGGRIVCPQCRSKTSQVIRPDTYARNLQVFCRECKWIGIVNIDSGQCSVSSPC